MIRYLVPAGFWIACLGLPLQAGTLAPTKPKTPNLPPALAKVKTAKTTDKSVAKTSMSGDRFASSSKAPVLAIAASAETPALTKDKTAITTEMTVAKTSMSKDKLASLSKAPVPSITASAKTVKSSSCSTAKTSSDRSCAHFEGRLARLTAYWASEGDHYTSIGISSTGIHLHDGYCAVDPRIIPYGSVVTISGVGKYLAVDTGSAVISREAARETGHTPEERAALVIDLYFESSRAGEDFAATGPKFASITWQTPGSANNITSDARNMVAESEWNKLRNKQLSE